MSHSIIDNLNKLVNIKSDFRTKIQEKGILIPVGTSFKDYPGYIDELVHIEDLPRETYYEIFDLMWYCTEMKDCPNPSSEMDEIDLYFSRILDNP